MIKLIVEAVKYGGIAQLARAFGSYPECRRFESHYRYLIYGPVVKRLRHRPFTAVTRVRFSSGSETPPSLRLGGSIFHYSLKRKTIGWKETENSDITLVYILFEFKSNRGWRKISFSVPLENGAVALKKRQSPYFLHLTVDNCILQANLLKK